MKLPFFAKDAMLLTLTPGEVNELRRRALDAQLSPDEFVAIADLLLDEIEAQQNLMRRIDPKQAQAVEAEIDRRLRRLERRLGRRRAPRSTREG